MEQKEEQLGITVKKSEDFNEWYNQVVLKADMIDYSLVSGCIIFKPNSYSIWEKIQKILESTPPLYENLYKEMLEAAKIAGIR